MTPAQGWAVLEEVSQHTDLTVRAVAEPILLRGRDRRLPPEIRAEPEGAPDRYGPRRIPGTAQD
ncbi:hypothetical protein [Streptomyces cinereospinus]|uniref:ANTAR domain-containing protein n=1 Tax=Streptomyces cinereospinus TaxID=285561 RepID=A0ABV5N2Z6_9ACTN